MALRVRGIGEKRMSRNSEPMSAVSEPEDRWLTPKEICSQLHIPEQTFYQWRVKHMGPRAYRIGRHLRINRVDFDIWLASRLEP